MPPVPSARSNTCLTPAQGGVGVTPAWAAASLQLAPAWTHCRLEGARRHSRSGGSADSLEPREVEDALRREETHIEREVALLERPRLQQLDVARVGKLPHSTGMQHRGQDAASATLSQPRSMPPTRIQQSAAACMLVLLWLCMPIQLSLYLGDIRNDVVEVGIRGELDRLYDNDSPARLHGTFTTVTNDFLSQRAQALYITTHRGSLLANTIRGVAGSGRGGTGQGGWGPVTWLC